MTTNYAIYHEDRVLIHPQFQLLPQLFNRRFEIRVSLHHVFYRLQCVNHGAVITATEVLPDKG